MPNSMFSFTDHQVENKMRFNFFTGIRSGFYDKIHEVLDSLKWMKLWDNTAPYANGTDKIFQKE